MPTSPYAHIEFVAYLITSLKPSSILDIGLGNGKMGFIARDVLDVMLGERYLKQQWVTIIDGIEIYPDYIQDHQRYIYNNIYIGNAYDVIDTLSLYDLIILGDVLEHFDKERAWLFLDKCALHSHGAILINIPIGYVPQPAIYNNEYERHLSSWQGHEFEPFAEKSRIYTLSNGMSYGCFLLSKEKYSLHRAELFYRTGNNLKNEGRLQESAKAYTYSLKLRPDVAETYNNLGTVYAEMGKINKALSCLQNALQIKQDFPVAHFNIANAYRDNNQIDHAVSHYLRAIELNPNMHESAYNLGNLYQRLGLYQEALIAFDIATTVNSTHANAYNNSGAIRYSLGEFQEAEKLYKKAIEADPAQAEAHWNLSLLLLLTGNFKEGWAEYEWRWKTKDYQPRTFNKPLWDGRETEGIILLHAEQGIGDAIHFVRYVPMVKAKGLRVLLQCHEELVSLFTEIDTIDRVLRFQEPLPYFDFHCPLMSLPLIFNTDLNSIPAKVPYININSSTLSKGREKIKDSPNLRVGIVWAGKPEYKNDMFRSIPLSLLEPLLQVDAVDYYSLQMGESSAQARQYKNIKDLTVHIRDFSDTAGLIANLDLIISVDTAVAHLAGALAKPVWIMLPYCPDWRWMLKGSDSPWYPTARLFRQRSFKDWEGTIIDIKQALQDLLKRRSL